MPGSPTTPGRMDTRDDASIRVAFHENDHVGTRDYLAFAAQWLAYVLPCRRFAVTLTGASARLGADADRYSFTVGDFHLLLFAGFDRRTRISSDSRGSARSWCCAADSCVIHAGMQATEPSGCGITTSSAPR
jgi:hypothetical protein